MASQSDREVLPKNIKPTHYDIKLRDLNFEKWTFRGTVVIDFDVKEDTDAICVNYRRLTVNKATVKTYQTKTESDIPVSRISHDEKTEVVTISLGEKVPSSVSKLQVTLEYDAQIWDDMAGFYRSMYDDAVTGTKKPMLSTQFESTDARRAFPCADEPNLKATFDFAIQVPKDLVALGNMPERSSTDLEGGLKEVAFETSPTMSTYLVAWAVGDFEYIETTTERSYNGKKIPVRLYTVKGKKEKGQLALENAAKIIDLLSETFDIDYPFPKADLIAISGDYLMGAMENIGLITFRETTLLFDPATSDSSYKIRVVYVVAHELAHQWFGNMVTMDWWNELWLNEGFATWVGWYIVDKLYPEFDVFTKFVVEALQGALNLDALRGSHPIEVPVRNGKEIDQIFDHISYLKGASTIHMLATQLTTKTFLKGVSNYLKGHMYGNAKTTDLWDAISEVSGVDVAKAMSNWTGKIGFPVVNVEEKGDDVILTQNRFLSTGDVDAAEDETVWWVPLVVGSSDASVSDATKKTILEERKTTLTGLAKSSYKLNKEQTGVYRVAYPADRLTKLAKEADTLSARDRVGLVADSASIAAAGLGSTAGLLDFIKIVGASEKHYFVWQEISARLANIRATWGNTELSSGLNEFTKSLMTPLYEKLGWEFAAGEDFLTSQLRSLVIASAGTVGVEDCITQAKARFAKWASGEDKSAIHPSLKIAVFSTVIRNSTGEELANAYEALRKELNNPSSVDAREACASAMAKSVDTKYAEKTLELIMNGEVLAQDIHTAFGQLALNSASRQTLWNFFETRWDDFYGKFSSNMVVVDRVIKLAIQQYSTKQDYNKIKAFFANKDTKGYDRSLGQALDVIRSKYQWVERDSEAVAEWLKTNGF